MELVFTDMNNEVRMLADSHPAESLIKLEPEQLPGIPYCWEIWDRLCNFSDHERRLYAQTAMKILHGEKLSRRMDMFKSNWPAQTPMERLRGRPAAYFASLPMVGKVTAQRAEELWK